MLVLFCQGAGRGNAYEGKGYAGKESGQGESKGSCSGKNYEGKEKGQGHGAHGKSHAAHGKGSAPAWQPNPAWPQDVQDAAVMLRQYTMCPTQTTNV